MNTRYEIYFNAWYVFKYVVVRVEDYGNGDSRWEVGAYGTYEEALQQVHQMTTILAPYGVLING